MAKAKYKNDYKSSADNCVVVDPQTIISIGGDETFMTTSFRYHGTPVIGRAAIGFYYYPSNGNVFSPPSNPPLIGNIGDFSSELTAKRSSISNGPWDAMVYAFPPNSSLVDDGDHLVWARDLRNAYGSILTENWKITSLTTPDLPTAVSVGKETVLSYVFTTVSGDYRGNLPSEAYENRFGNTVRQTGEVPTDGAAFETYLGQLGLSADANNAVSGYITSSAYSAGIAPPGGEYTVYTTDFDSPVYSSSSFFSSEAVSFSFESPCARLASVNQASDINFGYYASFQGPTP